MEIVVHWSRLNDMQNVIGADTIVCLDKGRVAFAVLKYSELRERERINKITRFGSFKELDENIACNNG